MPLDAAVSPTIGRAAVVALTAVLAVCKVYCERHCGSRFEDIPSRTVLAPIVFQGKQKSSLPWTRDGRTHYNVTFSVARVFKGTLRKKDSGSGYRYLVVGIFGDSVDKEKCVGPKILPGLSYIVFLGSTVVGRAGKSNTPIYRITGFPEPASEEVVEEVRKYARDEYAKHPRANIQSGPYVNGTLGSRLQLICKVSGRPFPVVEWTKEDRILKPRKGLNITLIRQRSKLRIHKLKETDLGLYRCRAVNALGTSTSSESHVSVGQKAHSYPCPNQSYCHNNGKCFIVQSLGIRYCQCDQKFEGERCKLKKVDLGPSSTEDMFQLQYALPVVGVALTAIVLTSITIIIYLCCRSCWQKRKIRKAEEQSENSYRPYSLGYQEESLKSNRGKRQSKSNIPEMKNVGTQTEELQSPISPRMLAIVKPDGAPSLLHFRSKTSSNPGKASSLQRARLNGISATPPESLACQLRIHSPVAEFIPITSDVKDKSRSARIVAMDDEPRTVIPFEPFDNAVTMEESKRKSEYDNCWLEDDSEQLQNTLHTSALTEQNHSDREISNSDPKRSPTTELTRP